MTIRLLMLASTALTLWVGAHMAAEARTTLAFAVQAASAIAGAGR